ncbi:MAG: hypothetical protein ACPGUD_07015 [Parashewanella sp.]
MNSTKKKNRNTLFLLFGAFIIPVVIAKLVLSMDWYQGSATNKGELLPESLSYQTLAMDNPRPHKWQMIYLLPDNCDTHCQQQLYLLHQTHTALGREQDRVAPVILLQKNSDKQALKPFSFTTAPASSAIHSELAKQQIIIVDPMGKLVTRYPLQQQQQQLLLQGKAMMNDLRKMLKMSRIG